MQRESGFPKRRTQNANRTISLLSMEGVLQHHLPKTDRVSPQELLRFEPSVQKGGIRGKSGLRKLTRRSLQSTRNKWRRTGVGAGGHSTSQDAEASRGVHSAKFSAIWVFLGQPIRGPSRPQATLQRKPQGCFGLKEPIHGMLLGHMLGSDHPQPGRMDEGV